MAKNQSKDMTVGNPFQIILFFAIPVLIGNVFQQLYSMVDTIIVGQSLGTEALAAVGSTGSLNFLVNGFSTGIAGGFAVLPAQFFGAKDEKRLKKSVGQAILLCLFFTVLLTALSVIFTRPVLVLMKTPENIIGMAGVYIKTIFWGICATILYNMCSCVIRALGDSKTPLYFLILASFLNIGLDLLFIIVFKWGVFGAAFATVLSQGVSGILCVIYALKKYSILHLSKEDFKPDFSMMGKHLVIGLPMAFQFSITAIGTIVLQSALNTFGSDKIAAYTAGCKVEQLVTQIGPAIGVTMANYAGQNLGAGKYDRIFDGMRKGFFICIAAAAIGAAICIFGGEFIVSWFVSNPSDEIFSYAMMYLKTVSWFFLPLAMIFLYRNALQGLGEGLVPMLSGVIELVCRFVAIALLQKPLGYQGICLADPAAWVGAGIPLMITYIIWKSKKIRQHSSSPA